ncbi:MAG TPA: hypothetical protein VND98_03910 [Solirubrobacterales bacterium]|nr:hypothetical protein [Solirubrobacterales bacterium]
MAFALGALALAAGGCGAQGHANDPRPSPPVRFSVTITSKEVRVQPTAVGLGPEPTQQIPQNKHHAQPPIRTRAPLAVAFVVANLSNFNSHLEVRGPRGATSGPIVANGNGTLQAELPAGRYTLSAADIPAARPAHLVIGPYRSSSQNNVLLP